MKAWQKFLKEALPDHPNCFAIVEMAGHISTKGIAREACAKENMTSQMIRPINMKTEDDGTFTYKGGENKHRANSAARDLVLRHTGFLYGNPQEIYQAAGIKEEIECLAFYLKRTQTNILYPIAVKLAVDGAAEVLLPDKDCQWLLYGEAAPVIGKIFADERRRNNLIFYQGKGKIRDDNKKNSKLRTSKWDLKKFILNTLKSLKKPTIALIDADTWRNDGVWPQLRNADMLANYQALTLNFGPNDPYKRDDPKFENLLGVVRMRTGLETPQYITDTKRDFQHLTGFLDTSIKELPHYFSIARLPVTAKGQNYKNTRNATMLDTTGGGIAYKHPQVVEFVPFFVRADYQTEAGLKQLCRVPHYLRTSPAWVQGNILYPYPYHLAHTLVDDQLCILGMD